MKEICGNPDCKKACSNDKVCSKCKATPYCQVQHWKAHKKLCKSLNAGRAQQLYHPDHETSSARGAIQKLQLVANLADTPLACQEMYRLFAATTLGDDRETLENRANQMKKLAMKIPANDKVVFLQHMTALLLHLKKWQVGLPTSPVLVLLQSGVDANANASALSLLRSGVEARTYPCLCFLASQHSTKNEFNENQVIIGRQLIEAGANVNLPTTEAAGRCSPLLFACSSSHCTNLDFIQLLLENGANPNQPDAWGVTPLMNTLQMSVCAAIFMLTFEHDDAVTVDVNCRDENGRTVLGMLRNSIYTNMRQREAVALTGKPVSDKGWTSTGLYDELLTQFREMESLLVARGAEAEYGSYTSETDQRGIPRQPHVSDTLNIPPCDEVALLDCDVSRIFKMDILRDGTAPNWCKDLQGRCSFFIDDNKALQFQAHEKEDHLHSAGGCKPKVGQKIQLQCNLPVGSCRLAGKVIHMFRLPSDSDLKRTKRSANPSMLYESPCPSRGLCQDPDCALTRTGKRFDILRKFGALHTQQVKGTVKLVKEHEGCAAMAAFFGVKKKYDIILRCNDNHSNMWELARIEPHQSKKS